MLNYEIQPVSNALLDALNMKWIKNDNLEDKEENVGSCSLLNDRISFDAFTGENNRKFMMRIFYGVNIKYLNIIISFFVCYKYLRCNEGNGRTNIRCKDL